MFAWCKWWFLRFGHQWSPLRTWIQIPLLDKCTQLFVHNRRGILLTVLLTFCVTLGSHCPLAPGQKWDDHLPCFPHCGGCAGWKEWGTAECHLDGTRTLWVRAVTHLKVSELLSGRTKAQTGRHGVSGVCVVSSQNFIKNQMRQGTWKAHASYAWAGLRIPCPIPCGTQHGAVRSWWESANGDAAPGDIEDPLACPNEHLPCFWEICQNSATSLRSIPWTSNQAGKSGFGSSNFNKMANLCF